MVLKRIFLFISIIGYTSPVLSLSAITTEQYGGRFGDQLLLYCFGKYCAKHLNVPFLFRPFPNSELLALYDCERHYTNQQFRQKRVLRYNKGDRVNVELNTLYEVPFWAPTNFLEEVAKDKELTAELREMIKPRYGMQESNLPNDRVTVAVHVRKGGGFDRPLLSRQRYTKEDLQEAKQYGNRYVGGNYQDVLNAPKFPPDQFYIDQIIHLSEILYDQPLYVFIFTDDQNPAKIMDVYKQAVNKSNIVFDCRRENNHHTMNIVDDLVAMAQFDYLIRPESAFSIISQIIGEHKLIIHPISIHWYGDILHVENVEIIDRTKSAL